MQLVQTFERYNQLRQDRGLSLEDLSFDTGVDRSHLSEFQNSHTLTI